MKLATWNVNSLKVRLPHVLQWLGARQPDVLCLQETKLEDGAFPVQAIREAGYHSICCGQRTYNGVAILSRHAAADVIMALPDFDTPQKRLIAATIDGVRIICVYVPNGESVVSEKYAFKLRWFAAFAGWLQQELAHHPRLAVLGDFNVAPQNRDVYDPAAWEGHVLFSQPERDAFQALLALGLTDSFRIFEQPEGSFTWWDYRLNAFRRKMGLRIDHILLSRELAARCSACVIDIEPRRAERPSDHAPVMAEIAAAT
ncbi:MAG TPA: exodeoxyribonuclease III [Burkholderiales bacterium]|nr:exodeoxyribonuclease III [Burkholderiales bacterium]